MSLSSWLSSLAQRGSRDYAPLRTERQGSTATSASDGSSVADDNLDDESKGRLTAHDLRHALVEESATEEGMPLRAAGTSRRVRLALVAALLGGAVALFLLALPLSSRLASTPPLDPNWMPTCPAKSFSTGQWVARDPPPAGNATIWDSTGFSGCAQNWFRNEWHLGLVIPTEDNAEGPRGVWPMSGYRRQAGRWTWRPEGKECAILDDRRGEEDGDTVQGIDVVRLLQDLVDRGGWLIVGDSLSQQQFFSLGCLLFPHVRALWPYPPMSMWHQIKEEHLLLDPRSPLIAAGELSVPEDFDYEGTPLISHVRTDHGLAPSELVDAYASFYASSSPERAKRFPVLASLTPHPNRQSILTPVETFSPSLDYYLDLFLRPASYRNITTGISPSYFPQATPPDSLAIERNATRSAHYRALIFSTAAHFSDRHFTLPQGPVKYTVPESVDASGAAVPAHEELGNAQVEFFDVVFDIWAARVDAALREAMPEERDGKVVVVRPSSGGHNDCHEAFKPLVPGEEVKSDWYSWGDMPTMNDVAEALVEKHANPQMVFLDLAKPASLRPDAHTNDDCLHLSTGTGVIEGWTRYISYYLRERAAYVDEAQRAAHSWTGRLKDVVRWPY